MGKINLETFQSEELADYSKIKGGQLSLLQTIYAMWQATPWPGTSTWSDNNGDGIWTNGTGGFVDTNTGQWWSGPIE